MKRESVYAFEGAKRRTVILAYFILIILLFTFVFAGCEQTEEKTVVTLLASKDFVAVERLVEETYSDIDLRYERQSYPNETLRKLQKGDGSDLVIIEQFSTSTTKEHLLDISDTLASTLYDGTVMQQLKIEGKTYVLPLPGEYSGYIVNKTLFEKEGIELPTTNDELATALETLKSRSVGVGEDNYNFAMMSSSDFELGNYLIGLAIPDFLGTVEGVKWLADFKAKNSATLNGNLDLSFEVLQKLMDKDLIDLKSIAQVRNSIVFDQRMSDGTLAAMFGTSDYYYEIIEKNEQYAEAGECEKYEYELLPLLSNSSNNAWFLRAPSGYMGINNTVDNKTKEACVRILNLISTQAGQDALIEDINRGLSYLQNYTVSHEFTPRGMGDYIGSQYIYNLQFPDKVITYLGKKGREYIKTNITIGEGSLSVSDVLKAVDSYYYNGSVDIDYDLTVAGAVSEDMLFKDYNTRKGETEIGNFIADAVAEMADAPIAVVNGGSIRASIYKGEVYGYEFDLICPFGNLVSVVEISGKTLWDMLENGLALYTNEFPAGRFLQVSGIRYVFNAAKPVGSRVISVSTADGEPISLSKKYTVAVNEYMLGKSGYAENNGDGYIMLNYYDESLPKGEVTLIRETKLTYATALKMFFEKRVGVIKSATIEGRIINKTDD